MKFTLCFKAVNEITVITNALVGGSLFRVITVRLLG